MSVNLSSGTIVNLLNQVDQISHGFVMQGYQNLVTAYSDAVYGLVALAVIAFGYATLHGWIQLSLVEVGKKALLIGVILSFALNWGDFSEYIYTLFTQTPNEIASQVISAIPNSTFNNITTGNEALQQAWNDGIGYCMAVWRLASITNPFAYLWAILMLLLVLIFIGLALIDLIIAKFGLAIFLVLAPVAIPMLLFKPTKEAIFDGWFKHLTTFALIPIFIYSALALGLALLGSVSSDIKAAIAGNNITVTAVAPYAIYSLVCIGLLVKAAGMAASMANGFSMGAGQHIASYATDRLLNRDKKKEPDGNNYSSQQTQDKPNNNPEAK